MELLESYVSDNKLGYLFECVDGLFNISNMLFSDRFSNDGIVRQLICGLVKLSDHY